MIESTLNCLRGTASSSDRSRPGEPSGCFKRQPKTQAYTFVDKLGHYIDVIMGAMASQITSLASVYSIVYSGSDQREHQSSASLAFVWGIHRCPLNSQHKWPVTRKIFPFDDVIMIYFLIDMHYCRRQHQSDVLTCHLVQLQNMQCKSCSANSFPCPIRKKYFHLPHMDIIKHFCTFYTTFTRYLLCG